MTIRQCFGNYNKDLNKCKNCFDSLSCWANLYWNDPEVQEKYYQELERRKMLKEERQRRRR